MAHWCCCCLPTCRTGFESVGGIWFSQKNIKLNICSYFSLTRKGLLTIKFSFWISGLSFRVFWSLFDPEKIAANMKSFFEWFYKNCFYVDRKLRGKKWHFMTKVTAVAATCQLKMYESSSMYLLWSFKVVIHKS